LVAASAALPNPSMITAVVVAKRRFIGILLFLAQA
jgi:hypothetical protein